ncbi:NAD(P)/FAD-dependent oxidoreductase [uncultured Cocleimonas sp.]|uniref:NAD(P)/FAD-dependent oxidoreductase n=1 Tax=uncultured Cocleimonas sp. TaxID=1051587 RepID=UPI00262F43FA|nr:FAD-dependent oxidoreductase [uncultured Cocleimonas sp.]
MSKTKQSISIIGSGVTGLSAAWLLNEKYDVTLFEKNDYLGGHTHTHDVLESDTKLAIDSGFIVYNEKNYPNLVGLFEELEVKTQATDMSFAFSMNQGELEYAGSGLKGMFAQRGNLVSIKHWRLIQEIIRFNKTAHAELPTLEKDKSSELSLGDFLKQHNFSKDLQQNYLLPMGAAIWSCPVEIMNTFPAHSFLRFFANHGLIDLQNRPQWRSVVGGSREYIRKMMPTLSTEICIKGGAESVSRTTNKDKGNVEVISDGKRFYFDQVIFACHADEALKLIDQPSEDEIGILSCFKYQENITYLHTDETLMPKRKNAWCSWNYLAQAGTDAEDGSEESKVTATYWMNNLQKIKAEKNYLVTLNPYQQLDETKVIKKMTYHHPVFDRDAIYAQSRLEELQGENNCWFCGSYTGYGFHEDALASSVKICEKLGVIAPWKELATVDITEEKAKIGGSQ